MIHQEDGGMQREMAKVAFKRGIWSYVLKMDTQLRRYVSNYGQLKKDSVNAVSLAQKVPSCYTLIPGVVLTKCLKWFF